MDYLNRQEYIKNIKPFIGKNLIKVIVGQRRVGKSYFLFQLIDYIKIKNKNASIISFNIYLINSLNVNIFCIFVRS